MQSLIHELYRRIRRDVPAALEYWDDDVYELGAKYREAHLDAQLNEIHLGAAVFVFDHLHERVLIAYGISEPQLTARDKHRMRGFPDVNKSVQAVLGAKAFLADRGHFLGHASGGALDINLFPQRRELNRGWSPEGRRFREMERHVANAPGTFFYHRPAYDDATWIPKALEYGVLRNDVEWWVETFQNKF